MNNITTYITSVCKYIWRRISRLGEIKNRFKFLRAVGLWSKSGKSSYCEQAVLQKK